MLRQIIIRAAMEATILGLILSASHPPATEQRAYITIPIDIYDCILEELILPNTAKL